MKKKISFFSWLRKRVRRKYKEYKNRYKIQIQNPTVEIEDDVKIINHSHLHLGKHIFISKGTILDCGMGEWCNHGGRISIGDYVYIAAGAILLGAGDIEIQPRCRIGTRVLLTTFTPDLQKIKKDVKLLDNPVLPHKLGKITVEDSAMIGPNCIILMGVTIGRGAIVAPGSIVRHDVAPNSFVFPNTRINKKQYPNI
jgi:acetyltransferase-like isoleucine patch superfamily enzyme